MNGAFAGHEERDADSLLEFSSVVSTGEPVDVSLTVDMCPLFLGLSGGIKKCVRDLIIEQDPLDQGSVIFRRRSDANAMYFVLSGSVEICSESTACLATVSAGGFFGEVGVFFSGNRSADAIVKDGPCHLAILQRTDLEKAAAEHDFREMLFDNAQKLASVKQWFVRKLPLFAQCAEDIDFIKSVAQTLKIKKSRPEELLIREGDEGHNMFFLFEGTVKISKSGRSVTKVSAPSFFGEVALLYAEPRNATVKSACMCHLYVLEQGTLQTILQEYPEVIGKIYTSAQETTSLKSHLIRKIPLFQAKAHDEEFMANMTLALESSSVAPQEHVVRQGDASAGCMYVLAHGNADVLQITKAGEPAKIVARHGPGDFFGEISLLLDTPRTASVVARGHCHFYILRRDAFETLAVVYHDWWRSLSSERGVLRKKLESTGIGIEVASTTQTHGLKLPRMKGITASEMLMAAQEPCAERSIPRDRLCVVCLEKEKDMLSNPCGHVTACEECHARLRQCPICRKSITAGTKAFF